MKALKVGFGAALLLALGAGPAGAAVWSAQAGEARAAAPDYVSSSPEDGAMLEEPPAEVSVTFDEPIDPESTLSISDECGRKIDDGNVQVEPVTMRVGVAKKPYGTYTVTYFVKGIGGVTGQHTGTFSFMVHSGARCGDGGGHGKHNGGGNGHQGGNRGGGNRHEGRHRGGGGIHDVHSGTQTDHGMDQKRTGHAGRHDMNKHGKHGRKGRHDGHGRRPHPAEPAGQQPPQAADDAGLVPPDGAAVLTALGASLALGAAGGWFLRMSGAR